MIHDTWWWWHMLANLSVPIDPSLSSSHARGEGFKKTIWILNLVIYQFFDENFLGNLGNGHSHHSLLCEELGEGVTVFRPPSIHAMQHLVKHILHLQLNLFLCKKVKTSKPISAETKGGDMVLADLMSENTNLDKLVPVCTTWLTQSNVGVKQMSSDFLGCKLLAQICC